MSSPFASRRVREEARAVPLGSEIILALAVTLLAGALRFYQLGFQSLWLDEAASVAFASGDIPYIFRFTFSKEPNPPLYYLLLHFWMPFVGTSEAAVRGLSALAGTLSIPLLWAIGRRMFNSWAGLLGATVMAISPFHIWLSQETRTFATLTLVSLVTLYALISALESDRRLWWIIYGTAALATMYLHLFGLLVVAAFVLSTPLLKPAGRTWVRPLAVATAIPFLMYVPWLLSLLNQFGEPQWRSRVGLFEIVRQTAKTVPLGEEMLWSFAGRGWLVWTALAALPLPFLALQSWLRSRGVALLFWLSLPVLASWVASYVSPVYAPRYLTVIAPAYYLAIGVGLERAGRLFWPAAPLGLALLAATAIPVLAPVYGQTIKEDYRSAAHYLKQSVQKDDAIVIMAGYLEYAFLYYGVDGETPLGDVTSAEQVAPALAPITDTHPRVWFVQSHYEIVDPGGHAQRWLLDRCSKVGENNAVGIRITELSCPSPNR